MNKNLFEVKQFSGVSIIMGAVDETEKICETVYTILETCKNEDIAEFIIMQSKRITPECLNSINRLKEEITAVPVNIYLESMPSIGAAIRDGIAYAKGSHTALLPSDFGIHPDCLAQMIEVSKRKPDHIVKTSRWKKGGAFKEYNKFRLVANKLGNVFLSLLYQSNLSDISSATQLFPSELFKRIRWQENNFTALLEMTLKPLRLGAKFSEIPVTCLPRTEGKSSNSIKKTLLFLPAALKYRFISKKSFYK